MQSHKLVPFLSDLLEGSCHAVLSAWRNGEAVLLGRLGFGRSAANEGYLCLYGGQNKPGRQAEQETLRLSIREAPGVFVGGNGVQYVRLDRQSFAKVKNKKWVKIKEREVNLKKVRAHLDAAKRCMVDFTNPVECHEQMITELPWPVRHGRPLSDRQVVVNVEAQTLTQRLMPVTQQAVKSEAVMRQLEAERSALFASVEDRCLEKLESWGWRMRRRTKSQPPWFGITVFCNRRQFC